MPLLHYLTRLSLWYSGRVLILCPASMRNIAAVVFYYVEKKRLTIEQACAILAGIVVFGVCCEGVDRRVVILMFSFHPGA
jgi:hypothetical protein